MINVNQIIKYNRTRPQLEELIVFCILVAGKTAKTIEHRINNFIKNGRKIWNSKNCMVFGNWTDNKRPSIFKIIQMHLDNEKYIPLNNTLKDIGIGCHGQKAEFLKSLVKSGINLKTCTVDELEQIKGIGPKTSRFFLMSSRRGVELAALDTHLLKWLKAQGVENVPDTTPSSKKQYSRLEQEFLKRVPKNKTPAEFDFEIWKEYSDYQK